MQYSAKDLFQLQTELVDVKMEIAVSKSIDRVIEQIAQLKLEMHQEIHELKEDMNKRFGAVESRLSAVEARLEMRNEIHREIRNRSIEYAYKARGLVLAAMVSAVVSVAFIYFHMAN